MKESDLNEVSVKIKGQLQFSDTNSAFALCLTKERIWPSQVLPEIICTDLYISK